MNAKPAVILLAIASLAGCGTTDPSIELEEGTLVPPDFVVQVQNGAMDTFRGVTLDFEIETPAGDVMTPEFLGLGNDGIDENEMADLPDDTFRFSGPQALPLGTRIEADWEARFRAVLGFSDRVVTRERRAHVGHDVRLTGLGLVDADEGALPEFQSQSPFLAGCRTIAAGEPFQVVVMTRNASFTSVPDAVVRATVSPQGQATADLGSLTETVDLPAETVSTGVVIGPFAVNLPAGVNQAAVDVLAGVDNNTFDFDAANDDIGPGQAGATGNPACFDGAGQFDREACQVCLIVQSG